MSSVSRRTVLAHGCLLGSVSLSGCLESIRTDSGTRLYPIEIHNNTESERSVSIRVDDGDEEVYRNVVTMPPTEADKPAIHRVADLPEDPGTYEVYFGIDRQQDDEAGEFRGQINESGLDCHGYILSIRSDDGDSKLMVHRLRGCDQ